MLDNEIKCSIRTKLPIALRVISGIQYGSRHYVIEYGPNKVTIDSTTAFLMFDIIDLLFSYGTILDDNDKSLIAHFINKIDTAVNSILYIVGDYDKLSTKEQEAIKASIMSFDSRQMIKTYYSKIEGMFNTHALTGMRIVNKVNDEFPHIVRYLGTVDDEYKETSKNCLSSVKQNIKLLPKGTRVKLKLTLWYNDGNYLFMRFFNKGIGLNIKYIIDLYEHTPYEIVRCLINDLQEFYHSIDKAIVINEELWYEKFVPMIHEHTRKMSKGQLEHAYIGIH